MKKTDLKLLGVKELTNDQLIQVNGGVSWWDLVVYVIEKMIEASPYIIEENCTRPQQPNYVPYADLGHR